MNPNTFNILSIDGGGYRNIMSIIMIMELELRSKRNASSMFNMIGGTSFGSIVAACLTYPTLINSKKPKFMSRDIMSLWNREVPKMFSNQNLISSNYKYYMYTMQMIEQAKGQPIYDGKNRQKFMENVF